MHKEALCINCGCCVSECNAMESTREFLGPQALAKACASSAIRATAPRWRVSRSCNGEHGIWECTRCYFCTERCPKGVDPRDAIAKLGAESIKEGIDRDMGAKHAKWFVVSAKTTGWLRETELVPKTQGIVAAIKQTRFALISRAKARCRRRSRRTSRRTSRSPARCYELVRIRASTAPRHRAGRARARLELAHGVGSATLAIRTPGLVPEAVATGGSE